MYGGKYVNDVTLGCFSPALHPLICSRYVLGRQGNHNDEVADIHAAVTFLGDEGELVVGVLGHSKGGWYLNLPAHSDSQKPTHTQAHSLARSLALACPLDPSIIRMQRREIRRGAWG